MFNKEIMGQHIKQMPHEKFSLVLSHFRKVYEVKLNIFRAHKALINLYMYI